MKKINCDTCNNNSCLIKKNFSEEWAAIIEKEKSQVSYRKGYTVFEQGKPAGGLFFVHEGMIRQFITNHDQSTEVFRFIKGGEVFGHEVIGNNHAVSAEAKIDSSICYFESSTLYELYKINPKSAYEFMLQCANEHSEFAIRVLSLSKMDLRQKIAAVLHYLYRHFGLNAEKELPDCFKREDIAGLAMTTAEQVSRQLSDFEEEKIIEKRARKIAIIQPSKLKSIIRDYSMQA